MRGNGVSSSRTRPVEILYVEDNPADVELWRDALAELPACSVRAVVDGASALDYLRQTGSYTDATSPDLILLDISLPGLDGHRVLAEVKNDPALHLIPVVVLSTSARKEEITRAYELGANAYVIKPLQLNRFRDTVRAIYSFWCEAAASPGYSLAGGR
jgi:two-component system, chemotaxis family, response regulator Rcp1